MHTIYLKEPLKNSKSIQINYLPSREKLEKKGGSRYGCVSWGGGGAGG
jgi:hypothetical protein